MPTCAVCQATSTKTGTKLNLCSKCRNVAYCSIECQRVDWKVHKSTCKDIAKILSKFHETDNSLLDKTEKYLKSIALQKMVSPTGMGGEMEASYNMFGRMMGLVGMPEDVPGDGGNLEATLKSHNGIATCQSNIGELGLQRSDNWFARLDAAPLFPKDALSLLRHIENSWGAIVSMKEDLDKEAKAFLDPLERVHGKTAGIQAVYQKYLNASTMFDKIACRCVEFANDNRVRAALCGTNIVIKRLTKSEQWNNIVGTIVNEGKVTSKFKPNVHWRVAIDVPSKEKNLLLRLGNVEYFGKGKKNVGGGANGGNSGNSGGSGGTAHTTITRTTTRTTTHTSGPVCRLCKQESMPEKPLLKPCACRGRKATVHTQCLLKQCESRCVYGDPNHGGVDDQTYASYTTRNKIGRSDHKDSPYTYCWDCHTRLVGDCAVALARADVVEKEKEVSETGCDNVDVGIGLNNLATTLSLEGGKSYLKEAEIAAKRSIAIKKNSPICGPSHPSTAASLRTLADIYVARGKKKEAVTHLREAVKILTQAHGGENDSHVAMCMNSLANALNALGDDLEGNGDSEEARVSKAEAMVLMERCVSIGDQWLKESSEGAQNDITAQVYLWWYNLGVNLYVRERETFKGWNRSLQNWASEIPKKELERHQNMLKRSIELLNRAYVFCSKTYGKKNRQTNQIKNHLQIAKANLAATAE